MKKSNVIKSRYTITPFWDKKSVKDDGTNRIMITINTSHLPQFRVTVKLRATKEQFQKALSSKGSSDDVKVLRREISKYISKAESIFDRMGNVSKDVFLRLFKSEANLSISNKTDVYLFYEQRIEMLTKAKRFGSRHTTKCSMASFKAYKPILYFEDLTLDVINGYRDYMLEKNASTATIGIYVRELKTMYNALVKDGLMSDRAKPFKDFVLGRAEKSQDVLYPEQIKALWDYV